MGRHALIKPESKKRKKKVYKGWRAHFLRYFWWALVTNTLLGTLLLNLIHGVGF